MIYPRPTSYKMSATECLFNDYYNDMQPRPGERPLYLEMGAKWLWLRGDRLYLHLFHYFNG